MLTLKETQFLPNKNWASPILWNDSTVSTPFGATATY